MAREKGVGEKGTDREKEYKKIIIIFLFTCATPGTPASTLANTNPERGGDGGDQ